MKQEPMGCIQPHGRGGNQNKTYQNSQRGRENCGVGRNFPEECTTHGGSKTNKQIKTKPVEKGADNFD